MVRLTAGSHASLRKTRRAPPTRSMVVRGDHVVPRRTPPKRKSAAPTRSMVVRGNTGPLTIPALRRAFESVDRFVAKKPSVPEFQKHWKKTFGKPVSAEAARDYLQFAAAKQTQSGGAAPLSYELGEPAGPAPNVPPTATPYVSNGFGFANVPSFINQCGTVDTTNPVPADMGTNTFTRMGGGRRTRKRSTRQRGGAAQLDEFFARPFGINSPPSMAQTAQTLTTGYNQFASPRPELHHNLNFHRMPSVMTGGLPPSSITF